MPDQFPNLPATTPRTVLGPSGMGVVPTTAPPAITGEDQLKTLYAQYQDLTNKITEQTKKATQMQDVAGGLDPKINPHFGLTFNQPQFAPPQGSRDARNQGIAKTVSGVANLVSMFVKNKQASETRDLAHKIHGIMDANDSVNQAKQVLQADPNNADAKKTLKDAQDHINDTFADKKYQKKLEKAFDINQIDTTKNEGPEHKAREMATKSYAEQLEANQNQKLQANVLEKQKLDLLEQQREAVAAQYKNTAPQVIQERKEAQQTRMQERAIQAKNAQIEYIQGHEDWRILNTQAEENVRKLAEIVNSKEIANAHDATAIKATKMRLDQQKSLFDTRLKALEQAKNTPEAKLRLMTTYVKTLQDEADKADKVIENNNKLAHSPGVKHGKASEVKAKQETYWADNRAQEAIKARAASQMQAVQKQMEYFQKHGTLPDSDTDKMPMIPSIDNDEDKEDLAISELLK